ncbi:MAG: hypothetical protein V2A77_00530 [Pseudomonadota bacterium]
MNNYHDSKGKFCSGDGTRPCPEGGCHYCESANKRHINPLPEGGGSITFRNDELGGRSTDQPISPATAAMVEEVIRALGLRININSTTGGKHDSPKSRHYIGKAVDINRINGIPVSPSNPYVEPLQRAFQQQPNIRENFGPAGCVKTSESGQVTTIPKLMRGHMTHIHVSGQE